MKKKITLLGILLLCTIFVIAQSTTIPGQTHLSNSDKSNAAVLGNKSIMEELLYEDFSDGGFENWTPMGEGIENWQASSSNLAGGEAPEAMLFTTPDFEGISRLLSPVINTSGNTVLNLNFLHLLGFSSDEYFYIRIETTSDGGTTWNEAWEMYLNTTVTYAAFETINVNTPDVGSEDFQFCFTFDGISDDMNMWMIDDISLSGFLNYDAMVEEINGIEGNYVEGDVVEISSVIWNLGIDTATFDVILEVFNDDDLVFESTQTVTDLPSLEFADIDFESWTSLPGQNITATVTTLFEGDENPDNDAISYDFSIIHADYAYCLPSGTGGLLPGFNFRISDFAFAGVNNTESGFSHNGYGYFTDQQAVVQIGESYDLTITVADADQVITVWIDLNQDYTFEDSEQVVYGLEVYEGGVPVTTEVIIPGFALPGLTYMRVGAQNNYGSPDDPCEEDMWGEWEDYAIEISGATLTYDVGVISINNYWIMEQGEIVPVATVQNLGVESVSFPVTMNIGTSYSSTVEFNDIESNEQVMVEFDSWNAAAGDYLLELETGLINDENLENNTGQKEIVIVEEAPFKSVIGEEGTGTWCGWCIRGIVYMDSMQMKYPETWIGIAVHSNDPMENPDYLAGMNDYFTGYPSGVLNRGITVDPLDFEQTYLQEIERTAPADITISNKEYNSTSNELSFTVTSEFVAPVADYRFSAVIIENGVTGTGDEWAQSNYYADDAAGPMAGYENMPGTIPAEDMVYEHVGRTVIGEVKGVEGSLPANINEGDVHSYEFSTILSEEWDINNIEIVGMLLDYNTGRIENGAIDHLITNISDQVEEQSFAVYPNPARDKVYIETEYNLERVQLLNISGQVIFENQVSGNRTEINTSEFESGIYFIKVFSHDQVITRKLVIE